jgi:small multidrug resistance pump
MPSAWLLLLSAIGIEVATTSTLPRTDGFRNPGWTLVVIAGYAASIWLLALVIRHIPVSVTYAVWSGVGTAGVALIGILFLGERIGALQAAALLMIIGGVVILNLTGAH